MRLPVVRRSELEYMQASANAWKDKSMWLSDCLRDVQAEQVEQRRGQRFRWAVVGIWMFVLTGITIGSLFFTSDSKPVLQTDYSGCISQAVYDNPIPDNRYQELVNALYTCGVYDG